MTVTFHEEVSTTVTYILKQLRPSGMGALFGLNASSFFPTLQVMITDWSFAHTHTHTHNEANRKAIPRLVAFSLDLGAGVFIRGAP